MAACIGLVWLLSLGPVSAQDTTAGGRWHDAVRLSGYYNHVYGYKGVGGLEPARRGRQSGSLDLFAQLDLDTFGVGGGQALLHLKSNWSRNINPRVGGLGEPIDDADGDHVLYVDQLWYQQDSPGRTLQLRVGYLDQQTILDRNAFANSEDRQFLGAFLDNNNAIIPLAIGPGVAVFFNATDWLSIVATASDATSSPFELDFSTVLDAQYFTYLETDIRARLDSANGPLTGHYRFGVFLDPRDRMRFDDARIRRSNPGFYLSFDQLLYGEPSGDDQGLGVFFRYGWRPDDVNHVSHFWSGGAQYAGLLPGGDRQVIGVGTYSAIGSALYRTDMDPAFDRETAYEVYYTVPIRKRFVLTPTMQYVRQPGALTTRDDVFVFALRARVSL